MIDLSDSPLPLLPNRAAHSHKGDYGRAVIVGGSLGMAGAPALAGMACLRSGAGLVTLLTPRCIQPTVASYCPAYMTVGLPDDGHHFDKVLGSAIEDLSDNTAAVAIGPGLGRSEFLTTAVSEQFASAPMPLVIDADGLNALAEGRDSLEEPRYARVLTPHAGEFARLVGKPLNDPNDDQERREAAAALAKSFGGETIVLLKGARTVVTDGERYAVNPTGNPGMASGGSGDVLTGILTALLAQGLSAFDAARLGAHVHGLAGDLAAAKLGETSLIATDLIDYLPPAWVQLSS